MNAGVRISAFIESFTGISNAMVAAAPPAAQVMADAARFVDGAPMVAHNAAFDRKFWQAELAWVGPESDQGSDQESGQDNGQDRGYGSGNGGSNAATAWGGHPFACTLLLARRLYPQAPNHRLGTLADFHRLPSHGRAHRALADAETAAALLVQIQHDLRTRFDVAEPHHPLLMKVQACQRHAVRATLDKHRQAVAA